MNDFKHPAANSQTQAAWSEFTGTSAFKDLIRWMGHERGASELFAAGFGAGQRSMVEDAEPKPSHQVASTAAPRRIAVFSIHPSLETVAVDLDQITAIEFDRNQQHIIVIRLFGGGIFMVEAKAYSSLWELIDVWNGSQSGRPYFDFRAEQAKDAGI